MFNDRLRATRIARGYTLQDVCDATNLQMRTYQRYEGGQSDPPLPTLVTLADFLNVSTDFLLCRDDYLLSLGVSVDVPQEGPPRHPNGERHR